MEGTGTSKESTGGEVKKGTDCETGPGYCVTREFLFFVSPVYRTEWFLTRQNVDTQPTIIVITGGVKVLQCHTFYLGIMGPFSVRDPSRHTVTPILDPEILVCGTQSLGRNSKRQEHRDSFIRTFGRRHFVRIGVRG